jgi:RNA polymerase sigma-70 factor (ECF subfamily)
MECRAMFARLSELLDGELALTLCGEVEAHVRGCRPCEAFVRTLRLTVDLCRNLPMTPLPEELRQELRSLLAAGRVGTMRRPNPGPGSREGAV